MSLISKNDNLIKIESEIKIDEKLLCYKTKQCFNHSHDFISGAFTFNPIANDKSI